jgi:hypothetical protein
MPKKRFEERPYDPISADLVREVTAMKSAGPGNRSSQPSMAVITPRAAPLSQPDDQAELTITKRFLLSRGEDAEMNAFLLRLQQSARTKVTLSVLVRAALAVVMEAESRIREELEQQSFRLPSTHDRLALSDFEDRWRRSLQGALLR